MIFRRSLLVGAVTTGVARAARAGLPVPRGGRLAFRIMRKDSEIGTHVLTFSHAAGGLDVDIAVDIAVRFGPLVLFRYTLRGAEQWRGGVVSHVEAKTNNDGTPDYVRADRDAQGLWVEGSNTQRYLAPPNALPATHWNMAELDGPWINPQDGELLRPKVHRIGTDLVPLADGRQVRADDFKLTGDARLELWYSQSRQWTALVFTARDGSLVRYELT